MGALRDFVADMLESEGAAIEPVEPDGLEVLASEPLCAAMGWPEFARLGFAATLPVGAIRSACSTARSIYPMQSGACIPPTRHGHAASCLRSAIPPSPTKSATDWS